MRRPVAVQLSYRLGGADGVSVETRKWEWALGQLGFSVRRVAGEFDDGLRPDDVWLPFLAIDPVPGTGVDESALDAAIAGADLVIVENLCSLPLNVCAARTVARALPRCRARVLFHHHDLPWERPHLVHLGDEFPPSPPDAVHVTISEHARRTLADRRGIRAHTIYNAFDATPTPGDRDGTRRDHGFADKDLVLVQPSRALPRKGVPNGLRFADHLAQLVTDRTVHYWLTGPAEDGYGPQLARAIADASVPVARGRAARAADAYAAADLVVIPSTWEGFGNPVVEATLALRPVVASEYPVLSELVALGADPLPLEEPRVVAEWLRQPDHARLERAARTLGAALDINRLPDRIAAVFAASDEA